LGLETASQCWTSDEVGQRHSGDAIDILRSPDQTESFDSRASSATLAAAFNARLAGQLNLKPPPPGSKLPTDGDSWTKKYGGLLNPSMAATYSMRHFISLSGQTLQEMDSKPELVSAFTGRKPAGYTSEQFSVKVDDSSAHDVTEDMEFGPRDGQSVLATQATVPSANGPGRARKEVFRKAELSGSGINFHTNEGATFGIKRIKQERCMSLPQLPLEIAAVEQVNPVSIEAVRDQRRRLAELSNSSSMNELPQLVRMPKKPWEDRIQKPHRAFDGAALLKVRPTTRSMPELNEKWRSAAEPLETKILRLPSETKRSPRQMMHVSLYKNFKETKNPSPRIEGRLSMGQKPRIAKGAPQKRKGLPPPDPQKLQARIEAVVNARNSGTL